jgi:hypothetical protein
MQAEHLVFVIFWKWCHPGTLMRQGGIVIFSNCQVVRVLCLLSALLLIDFICFMPRARATQIEKENNAYVTLDLIGYNYTDRHISDYNVDNQGGGNVRLSSPTSGGGGIVCCVRLAMGGADPIIVRVRWQVGGCTYLMRSEFTGSTQRVFHYFYKEAYVEVNRPKGIKPSHLESHFYPDGSVVVLLTDDMSLPRLSLDESRPNKSKFQKCKNDKKPE